MSVRGVRQLKELIVRYSDYDGSSKGVRWELFLPNIGILYYKATRDWIQSDILKLAESNPNLTIRTVIKRCAHPYFRGIYGMHLPVAYYDFFLNSVS